MVFSQKTKQEYKSSKQQETPDISTGNELDTTCFQHNMAYRDFKDLPRRTVSDKIFRKKTFKIVSIPNYDRYQRGIASIVHKFFAKNLETPLIAQGLELFLKINNSIMNYISTSLENFREVEYTHLVKIKFGMLILQSCS